MAAQVGIRAAGTLARGAATQPHPVAGAVTGTGKERSDVCIGIYG